MFNEDNLFLKTQACLSFILHVTLPTDLRLGFDERTIKSRKVSAAAAAAV
jgi:hypothetical protein